jgi:exosortase
LSEGRIEARPWSLARSPAAAWLAALLLAAVGWREGLAFALSSGGADRVEQLLFDAADNPPWLISAVAAALVLSRARELRAACGAPGAAALASGLLAPGLALLAWGRFVAAPELSLLGALAMALGSAYALGGGRLLRFLAVPLGLLAFAVPAPGAFVNRVVYPLQLWTADYTSFLLRPLPVSALQSADVIRTARHNFLVIEGCSGLGSMEVLSLLALAWAWQTRATWRQGLVLVAAAPAIAFGLNGFRVASLVLFPESGVWSDHTTQGVVAFAFGALGIALLDRFVVRRNPPEEAPPSPVSAGRASARPGALHAAWLAAAALASLAVPRYALVPLPSRGPLLPETEAPWTSEDPPVDPLYLGSVRPERSAQRRYLLAPEAGERLRLGPEAVSVFVAEDGRLEGTTSLRSPKVEVPGRGWKAESRSAAELPGRYRAQRVVARGEARRALSYTLYLGVGGTLEEGLRGFLSLDRSPFRRLERAHVVRISTEIAAAAGGERRAERRLGEIFRRLQPRIEALEHRAAESPGEGG